ncbi:hypothetical protein [Streptomyces sp. NBC_00344]|uniref:hypothetical protein n=1 Tax=Streptomyces sp. NBC_00344 TaxID=2975720 RepID=UPI002E20D9D6
MRKLARNAATVAVAMVAAAGFAATSASATTTATWTVSGGPNFTGTAGKTTLTDTKTGTQLNCVSSSATGTAKTGSGLSGTGLADIKTISFTTCSGPLGIKFTVTPNKLPWKLNAVSYNASTGVTTGTITGISAKLSGATCNADIDGPSGANTGSGSVNATYTNSTHTLAVSGGNLRPYNATGCLGLINNGDATTFVSSYVVSPALTVTSP